MNCRQTLLLLLLSIFISTAYADTNTTSSDSPCGGLNSLLTLINRPSILDSPCTVPNGQGLLETGYTYVQLRPDGDLNSLPAAQFRYGLPDNFEVFAVPPNYIQQNFNPSAGFSPVAFGAKHELFINTVFVMSLEAAVVFPSGSYYFGYQNPGGVLNAIASYTLSEHWSIVGLAGVSSVSAPRVLGGGSYVSFNPIVDLVWTKDKVSIYGEIFAQTKSGLYQGGGVNTDAAIIYLWRPYLSIDFEVSHRISGEYGNYNDYIGTGLSILFS